MLGLSSSQMRSHGRGELLVSLCYQPQAARLTAVVLKARNIPRMDMTGLAGTSCESPWLHKKKQP